MKSEGAKHTSPFSSKNQLLLHSTDKLILLRSQAQGYILALRVWVQNLANLPTTREIDVSSTPPRSSAGLRSSTMAGSSTADASHASPPHPQSRGSTTGILSTMNGYEAGIPSTSHTNELVSERTRSFKLDPAGPGGYQQPSTKDASTETSASSSSPLPHARGFPAPSQQTQTGTTLKDGVTQRSIGPWAISSVRVDPRVHVCGAHLRGVRLLLAQGRLFLKHDPCGPVVHYPVLE
jgi:hypothetical protein